MASPSWHQICDGPHALRSADVTCAAITPAQGATLGKTARSRAMKALGIGLLYTSYLLIGFIQITATASGIQHLTGLWWMVSWFLALVFGWTPVIGTGLGIYGAHKDWGWDLLPAIALFVGLPLFFLAFAGIAKAAEAAVTRRR